MSAGLTFEKLKKACDLFMSDPPSSSIELYFPFNHQGFHSMIVERDRLKQNRRIRRKLKVYRGR